MDRLLCEAGLEVGRKGGRMLGRKEHRMIQWKENKEVWNEDVLTRSMLCRSSGLASSVFVTTSFSLSPSSFTLSTSSPPMAQEATTPVGERTATAPPGSLRGEKLSRSGPPASPSSKTLFFSLANIPQATLVLFQNFFVLLRTFKKNNKYGVAASGQVV